MNKAVRMVVAIAALLLGSWLYGAAQAADAPADNDASNLSAGLTPLAQLLGLMDTDKNGKVSKDEFMHYMEAEFEYADKNHDGELDPVELKRLVQSLTHPATRLPRVRK